MVVKDFLPISEAKITTEKVVQQKPTIDELTKIESPGKPVPASFIEKNEKKGKKTLTKAKKTSKKKDLERDLEDNSTIEKDSILIITEKPQAALKIASALGNERKYSENSVPYYELERGGDKIIVASAVGHLFNLTYKEGQRGWPIFQTEWIPSYNSKAAEFTKRYYDLLRKLTRRAKEVIIATDYDIEGEVIGWNVLRFICKKNDAKRMKFSTLTENELQKAFDSPEKTINWGNAYAGEARHVIDWLYGINLSRALMSAIKNSGIFRILSIGRVQGPALKIIVEREREINKFKSEPYWNVFAIVDNIEYRHPKDIFDKTQLEKFKDIKKAEATTEKTTESSPPPHPFDLTTLQREAYRLYKISPSEALSIAQKLYLDGLISYPRTSSQKIPDAIEPKKILKKLAKTFPEEVKLAVRTKPIEGVKSDPAHPSIYPTGDYKKLGEREDKLYKLIVKRFISAFSPDLITANKRITLTAKDNIKFTASAQTVLDKGWTAIYPTIIEESDLPDLSGIVKIDEIKFVEKKTEPPHRYTPASLVSILEKKNLGTKATRSQIVDTLFDRGYLDGKSIQATPLGLKLIEALEKYSSVIIDENLTRSLEEEMEKIQNSSENLDKKKDEVIEKAKRIIADISAEFKTKEKEIGKELAEGLTDLRKDQQTQNELVLCPTCKTGKLRIMYNKNYRRYFVACSAYPNCKQTYSLPPNALIKKAENKFCEADQFPKLLAIRKAKRPWEFCFNPLCPIEKEKREKWEARKSEKEEN